MWYKCDKCILKYKSEDELQEHVQTKHPDKVKKANLMIQFQLVKIKDGNRECLLEK